MCPKYTRIRRYIRKAGTLCVCDVRHFYVDKKNAYETTKKNVLYDMKTFLPSPGFYVVQLSSGRSEKTSSVTPLFYLTHGVITLGRNGLASFRNFSRFVISIFHFKFNLSSKPGSSGGAGSGYPSPPRPPLFVVQKRALRTSPQTPPLVSPMSSAFE